MDQRTYVQEKSVGGPFKASLMLCELMTVQIALMCYLIVFRVLASSITSNYLVLKAALFHEPL